MGNRGPVPQGPKTTTVSSRIKPPAYLREDAKAIFRETARVAAREGYTFSQLDAPLLAIYSTAVADALEAEKDIAREGWTYRAQSGYPVPNPRAAQRSDALKRAAGAAAKLGLARIDRPRIPKSVVEERDPFAAFIK